jgi:hypothetical protein
VPSNRPINRIAAALAVAVSLVVVTAHTARAAPAAGSGPANGAAAACPGPGNRVKAASNPAIYLIAPEGDLRWIPSETVYYRLWDTMDGVLTIDLGQCFIGPSLTGADLKRPGSSAIYIYDFKFGTYRWIVSEAVFHKYKFSMAKVLALPLNAPVGPNWHQ